MLLAVDVGNTDTVFGLYQSGDWDYIWRTRSLVQENEVHYESKLRLHFLEAGLWFGDVETVVLSSVVPALTPAILKMLRSLFGEDIIVVGPDIYPGLSIAIDHPHEIGADLIANAVAVMNRYQENCVVVDFGTALTFTTISKDRKILGVAILPGLITAVKALFANTAQLPEVPLELPSSAIGKNTTEAIQAGILLGYEGLVKSLLHRIRTELGGECIAVATGGLSSIIDTLRDEFVEIDRKLTLDGLRVIGESIRG
ncbi:type III pantothenate kinase [Dyadobacter pollutisoli]|jgi:type III pantothenate kinase|uniref:Type III pantothenate kinase n=1 Tax=Dyadobacter pollutisoli TaxID=2910158 RepID=A0A9E8SJY2_9BACT|nr:type III pantothenate kinase [Dyadobacter pollutisoli]WAC11358.1 type III pantothenate kinase [Dyadobacter pollutisoli]